MVDSHSFLSLKRQGVSGRTIDKKVLAAKVRMTANIVRLSDENANKVLQLLAQDALSNIVLIADCTQLRKWCDIRILQSEDGINAIFSVYRDLDFLATAFWCQDVASLKILMKDYANILVGKEFVAICTQEQLDQFGGACVILKPIKERQMVVDRATKLYCECKRTPVKLSTNDSEKLKELYNLSGTPAWTPNAMQLGPFYGIIETDGTIAAAAGVHFMTPYGTEIGNVATHPDYVRRGYAAACIKAVVEDVLHDSDLVILHYFEENKPAQLLYEKMGFRYSIADPVFFVRATCVG
ncbi:MAG: GNAT family N-acetyltransferase [Candidatus Thorarchaeota archaeon]|nr:GNAT family N-acetyltransferase [Candidatus Thorarchaeota archaeon]